MNLEFLIFGEYSQYVWPAFIFSFTICISFYIKTKRKLKKLEVIFKNEFEENENIEVSKEKVKIEPIASLAN
tara:strand:- start:266 stop:481 length:216 start_codon:yes stop_codon:yes gene_type:complete